MGKHIMSAKNYDTIMTFDKSATQLCEMYEHWEADDFAEKYPFEISFDEVVLDISKWCEDMLENVTVQGTCSGP